jgi:hypothetical protein
LAVAVLVVIIHKVEVAVLEQLLVDGFLHQHL